MTVTMPSHSSPCMMHKLPYNWPLLPSASINTKRFSISSYLKLNFYEMTKYPNMGTHTQNTFLYTVSGKKQQNKVKIYTAIFYRMRLFLPIKQELSSCKNIVPSSSGHHRKSFYEFYYWEKTKSLINTFCPHGLFFSMASHASRPDGVLILRDFHKVLKWAGTGDFKV
jgi:hypothetical protein